MSHYCEKCNYYTEINTNYKKHLLSKKHLSKIQNSHDNSNDPKYILDTSKSQPIVNPESTSIFTCKN